jgi:hypothetical protein
MNMYDYSVKCKKRIALPSKMGKSSSIKSCKYAQHKNGGDRMKNNTFFILLITILAGMATAIALPRSRRWVVSRMMNNQMLRRMGIRLGMSIAPIRERMIKRFSEGVA